MFRTLADCQTEPQSSSCLPLWDCDGEILAGEGWNMDFITQEVAGTLSPFVCRKNHFRGPFPLRKLEAPGWGPLGGGVLVETNRAMSSHMVTALYRAEDERMEAGTHGTEQRIGARSKEMPRDGV